MLKRYQVLLTDWLAEYAQFVSKEFDISFSEAVRILMCIGTVQAIKELFPQYKNKMTVKHMVGTIRGEKDSKRREEITHKLISQAYFETRKAIEFRLSKSKKVKKVML